MPVRWKIKRLLDEHRITPYRLWKESGLGRNTVYTITRAKTDRVDLAALGELVDTLERLTGEPIEVSDLLEVQRTE